MAHIFSQPNGAVSAAKVGEGLPSSMPEYSRLPPASRSGLRIREARSTDIDALAKIEAERFATDRLSRRSIAALAKSASAALVAAFRGNEIVGYAAVLTRRGNRSARLYSIAVVASATGQGTGSLLLAAAEDEARRRGSARMHLEVREDNIAAIRFYERAGYRPIGRRSGYYEDGMTALLFARELPVRAIPSSARLLGRAA